MVSNDHWDNINAILDKAKDLYEESDKQATSEYKKRESLIRRIKNG